MIDPTDIRIDDQVRLRKTHPCGGTDWRVVRLGADIGLVCLTCERKVLIPRGKFIKQVKAQLKRGRKRPLYLGRIWLR
jgi:hypothetical protein